MAQKWLFFQWWMLLYLWHTNNYNPLKVNTSTIDLSWTTFSWQILSNSLRCFLCRLGTDHPQTTHLLLSSGYHVLLSGVSTHALPSTGRLIVAHWLLWHVFTGLLPSNGRPSIVGCAFVGTCLLIHLIETAQSVTLLPP
jgi:hypothetical protein